MRFAMICIDPGIATGWCVLDRCGAVLATSVWGTAELPKSLDTLVRALHLATYQTHAVIERVPRDEKAGPMGEKLEAVRRDIMGVVETYDIPYALVMPGEWKPSRIARTKRGLPADWRGAPLAQHQKDAILMGQYVLDKILEVPVVSVSLRG